MNEQIVQLERELNIGERFQMPTERLLERIRNNLTKMEKQMQIIFAEDSQDGEEDAELLIDSNIQLESWKEDTTTCARESVSSSFRGARHTSQHRLPHRRGSSHHD